MRIVPLAAIPNQSFTATIDEVRWSLAFKDIRGVTAVDTSRDGVELLRGSRALAGETLIPYQYMQTGNFIFVVTGDTMPEYSQFGVSQLLVYLSAAELAAIPAATVDDLEPFRPSPLLSDEGFYLTTDTGEILTND